MKGRASSAALAATILLAGCGGITAPDLFILQRTGSAPVRG